MTTWQQVKAVYADDRGDTFHRDHFGYGRIGQLINTTGRNDIVEAKMANDGKTLWFYVRTDRPITPCTNPKWMRLFIDVKGSEAPDWEGFQYAVGNPAADGSKTALSRSRNGWNWEKIADLDYRVSDNEMVVAVPFAAIGMKNPKSLHRGFQVDRQRGRPGETSNSASRTETPRPTDGSDTDIFSNNNLIKPDNHEKNHYLGAFAVRFADGNRDGSPGADQTGYLDGAGCAGS